MKSPVFSKLFDAATKWFLKYLKKYAWIILGIIVLQFVQNYAFTLLPKVSTNFIFELFTPEKYRQIYRYFLYAIVIIVVKGALAYTTAYFLSVLTENIINLVRVNLLRHIINLPINYFKKQKTGNFISLIIDDLSKIRGELYEGTIRFISQTIYIILVLSKLFILQYQITLMCLGLIPVLYLMLRSLGNKMRSTSKRLQQNISDMSTNLHETITAVDVVKVFGKEDYEAEKFSHTSNKFKRTALKLKVLQNLFKPLNEFVIYLFGFTIIGVSGFFIIKDEWTIRGLTEYLLLLGILFTPISNIQTTLAQFKVVRASIDRVYSVLQVENTIKEPAKPIARDIEGNITFENVSFKYDKEPVLKDVNFSVKQGDVVALVGPSGAGKTTITNLILRLYDPERGKVLIDGTDLKEYSIPKIRSQMGIVTQNVILFNDSIYENIRYSKFDASREEIISAVKKARAYDFIMKMPKQFDTIVGEKGSRLSGGEKQRVAIARTILTNPQILILDEATSSIDSESEFHIQTALSELMAGKTSVVIAHRLSTIMHANKVLVVDKGVIAAAGTHDYLIKNNDLYKRFYELQYFR